MRAEESQGKKKCMAGSLIAMWDRAAGSARIQERGGCKRSPGWKKVGEFLESCGEVSHEGDRSGLRRRGRGET